MTDSFYVTLPSTASMDIYPDNAISHFTTRLQKPIDLDGIWEVGLCEVSLPTKWANIGENDSIRLIILEVIKDPITLHLSSRKHYVKAFLRVGFCAGPQQLIRRMNEAWNKLKLNTPSHLVAKLEPASAIFEYDEIDKIIRLTDSGPENIDISTSLALLLGVGVGKKSWEKLEKINSVIRRPLDMNVKVPHIYLYTDIVKHVPVGQTLSPLLRIIPMSTYLGNDGVEHYTKIYQKPHYLPLVRHYIEKIDIDLRNEMGEYVPFVGGKSIVKLHFKRIK